MKKVYSIEAYNLFPKVYDQVMRHVDYKYWAKYIYNIFDFYDYNCKRVIDLSCGTGSFLKHFNPRGFQCWGADLAHAMLLEARKKVSDPLICCDFNALPFKAQRFDCAVVLYDSINYLLDDAELERFFGEASRLLLKDGLLIFDVVTPHICREAFDGYCEAETINNLHFSRKCWYLEESNRQFNEVQLSENSRTYVELHEQHIWTFSEWLQILDKSPFKLLAALDNFSFDMASEKSERIHFVCRAKP